MKRTILLGLLICSVHWCFAQAEPEKKPSTLAFHAFYTDFNTAQQIRNTSLSNLLNKGGWSKIGDMQMGFGLNYLKGLNKKTDLFTTLDGSSVDYLFKDGSTQGSSKFLLDANAGLNLKLLTDRHTLVPYLSAGAGFSLYNGKTGFYIPAGAGFQFNLFKEAFVLTHIQYRFALSSQVNDHFQYAVGIGTRIGKNKKPKPPIPAEVIKVPEAVIVSTETKSQDKTIRVKVTDEPTGLPLPGVAIALQGPSGTVNGLSDATGQAIFSAVKAGNYSIEGSLHGITTTGGSVGQNAFEGATPEILITLTHNDPRFTLAGAVRNKTTRQPESGVAIQVLNTVQNSLVTQQSQPGNGSFNIPLEAAGDFTISGKKAGYISNIEKISTRGLSRSTTLYVALELEIEEAVPDKTIALKNIYYDSGSARIRAGASSDLEKLVTFLKDNPGLTIEIASHSDSRGSAALNLSLSRARAQEVANYLQRNGIEKGRLLPKGYGETQLINGCADGVKCTEAQHEENRRTEFRVKK